jgi:hypothetical protein
MKKTITIAVFSLTLLLAAGTLAWRLASPRQVKAQSCNNGTVQGIWGFSYGGLAGGLPVSGAGHTLADGSGNSIGGDTISVNGLIVRRTYQGTYNVNADCTGTTNYTDSLGNVFHQDFVVMNNANSVAVVQTDTGVTLAYTAQRQ